MKVEIPRLSLYEISVIGETWVGFRSYDAEFVDFARRLESKLAEKLVKNIQMQVPDAYTGKSWIDESQRGRNGTYVAQQFPGFDVPVYFGCEPVISPKHGERWAMIDNPAKVVQIRGIEDGLVLYGYHGNDQTYGKRIADFFAAYYFVGDVDVN